MPDSPLTFPELCRKLGESFKFPSVDVASLEDQQKNFEAMMRSWQAMASGAFAILRKQRELLDQAAKDVTAMSQNCKPGTNPQELFTSQAEFLAKALDMTMTATRDVALMAQKSSAESFMIVQDRMKQSYDEIGARLERKPETADQPKGPGA